MCPWNWEKFLKMFVRNFLKKQDFSISVLEWSENVYVFASISWLVSFGVYIYIQYLFDVVRDKFQTINIS